MSFLQWLGFKTRDAPNIRNDVRDSGTLFVFGSTNAGERVDEKAAMQISTVYACVRLLAESVAQLPLHLYKTIEPLGQEKAKDHPLYKILYRQPNPEMTNFSFWEVVMTHLLLWGNAYAQIIRDGKNNVLALYPLLPENVEVDRDAKGNIFYTYHGYTDEVPNKRNGDFIFRREEIFHIPGLSFNGLVGFSPIAMMKNTLGINLAVEKYGSAFFKNGGQPSGVLEHPGVLKDPDKIRNTWQDTYGGAANAHKIAVLEEGMHFIPLSLPPEDSQFLSTREFGVEEICRIFRVPPHMVQDLKRSTYSNIEHQAIDFVVHTLDPWLIRIEKAIVKDILLEKEQDEYFPKFNVDGFLRGDFQSRMAGYATGINNGIIKINEARQKENLAPYEDAGDDPIVNGTFVKLKDIGVQYCVMPEASELIAMPEGLEPPPVQQEEEPKESKAHAERKKQRKAERRGDAV